MMLTEAHYRIVEPLVYSSRIFGLCPITFTKTGNHYQIKYSRILVLYSYAYVIIFGIQTINGIHKDIDAGKNAVRMKSLRNRYIAICDMSFVFIIALYGIVTIAFRMKNFLKMLSIWSSVDNIIPITNYQKYRKSSIVFLSITMSAATLIFTQDMCIYCFQWSVSSPAKLYFQYYFGYYMLYYVMLFQEIVFYHMVFFNHIRLQSLNEHLSSEKNKLRIGLNKLFIVPYNHNGNDSIRSIDNFLDSQEKVPSQSLFYNGKVKFVKNTAERMEELLKVYGKIRESVELLNGSASYGTVLIILSCLLHLVVTPYFLLVEIFKKGGSLVFIVLQGVWVLAHIGRLLIIVEPCQRCLNEYKITSNLISGMALLDFDKATKTSLKNFALKFSYADISFHANGFFNIDRNLLTSISGAVSTYLVILFQFNGEDGS